MKPGRERKRKGRVRPILSTPENCDNLDLMMMSAISDKSQPVKTQLKNNILQMRGRERERQKCQRIDFTEVFVSDPTVQLRTTSNRTTNKKKLVMKGPTKKMCKKRNFSISIVQFVCL